MKFKTKLKISHSLIDMTPLVDVIFLMLIFFIVTSDILPLKSLHIENPVIDRNSAPLTTQILVVMDAQNVIYVGSKKAIVDLSSVKQELEEEITKLVSQHANLKPTVVLSVDRRVDYGSFLRLFSIVQESSPRIRLVYKPEDFEESEYL
ncbi:MAG: biopolymer transporter ExbD [Parachlamydiaceae bacterium]|nr:biopolymer transporter ExbD [Parachlamydiaceae bacterium]